MGDGRWGCLTLRHFLLALQRGRKLWGLPREDSAGLTMSGIQQSRDSRKNVLEASAKVPRQKCSSIRESLGFSNE